MLAGDGGAGWQQQVAAIYDPERMVEMVRRDLKIGVFGADHGEVHWHFSAPIWASGLSIWKTLPAPQCQDPDTEAAARERYAALAGRR